LAPRPASLVLARSRRAAPAAQWRTRPLLGQGNMTRHNGEEGPGSGAASSASSSADTPGASAAPIRRRIASACRSLSWASVVRPAARAHRPRPARACASTRKPFACPEAGHPIRPSRAGTFQQATAGYPRTRRPLAAERDEQRRAVPGPLSQQGAGRCIARALPERPYGIGPQLKAQCAPARRVAGSPCLAQYS
jgi:hypothetical protein